MPSSRRLEIARQVLERNERRHAHALAQTERQVRDSEAKLAELESFRTDYLRDFSRRAGAGIAAGSARSYQAFLASVEAALREQKEIVARARASCAEELRKWRAAARRSAALDRIEQRQRSSERQRAERGEQSAADEQAQRGWAMRASRHGA